MSDDPSSSPIETRIRSLLELLREDSRADVVYLSRFVDGQQHLRVVVGQHPGLRLYEGAASPLEVSYCWRIPQQIIPRFITDSAAEPLVKCLPGHTENGICGYLATPVHLADGKVYGTICCITYDRFPEPVGPARQRLNLIAALITSSLPQLEAERSGIEGTHNAIRGFLNGEGIRTVFQPIVNMTSGAVLAYEALTRFASDPPHGPDWWLHTAEGLGLGEELENMALITAVRTLSELRPDKPVSLNASPRMLLSGELIRQIETVPHVRTAVELTEHAVVQDYAALRPVLGQLARRGHLLAVDDAGGGFASFRHILELRPDVIKLDVSLTRHVDRDPARQVLASSLFAFGASIGARLVVEGVEETSERDALISLGYQYGQGYLFGRPVAYPEADFAELKVSTAKPRSRPRRVRTILG